MFRPVPIRPIFATFWIFPSLTSTVMLRDTSPSRVLTTFTLVKMSCAVEDAASDWAQVRVARQTHAISEAFIAPKLREQVGKSSPLASRGGRVKQVKEA